MKIKNTKAEELWHRIIIRKRVQELTTEYRKILGVPEEGFKDRSKANAFFKKILKNNKNKLQYFNEYVNKCKKDIKIPDGFNYAMFRYLFEGKRNAPDVNLTGCELSHVRNGAITIKVSINSTIEDIKSFVERERRMIKYLQKKYREKHKLSSPKRIRTTKKNRRRDTLIYFLSTFSKDELCELSLKTELYKGLFPYSNPNEISKENILSTPKEIIIQRFVEKKMNISISPEIVRTIIARQKKLREESM